MRETKITRKITDRRDKTTDIFLDDLKGKTPISIEKELELISKIKKGNIEARNKLIEANLRFLVTVAKQFFGKGLLLCDLINEGALGMIKAAEKYDETRGFKFISYAVWWIKQSIINALAEKDRTVRLPVHQLANINKTEKAYNDFYKKNGRFPEKDELKKIYDIDHSPITRNFSFASIDKPVHEDSDTELKDLLPNDISGTDHESNSNSLANRMQVIMESVLDKRECFILTSLFGLNRTETTKEQIAMKLGLTKERVRQIQEKSLKKLKEVPEMNFLKYQLN